VAPYGAEHPEDGLNPKFEERRLQVYSRASGRRLLDTAVRMPGERASRDGWTGTQVLGADPKGYLVLNHQPADEPDTDVVYAQPLRTGLAPWSTSEAGGFVPSIKAVAVDAGVVLVSRVDMDSPQLSGYDVATGRRIWHRAYPARSIVPAHPRCATGRDGAFVLGGRDWPVVVQARTGQPRGGTYSVCVRPDPVRPVGIYGGSGSTLGAVDLATGRALWELAADRARDVGLTATSVYDNRVYATTDTARLVLDARTGKELSRGWTRAPVERHDGWTVSYDVALGHTAVFPGPS